MSGSSPSGSDVGDSPREEGVVDAAFLVVAGKRPDGVAPPYRAVVEAPRIAGIGFEPTAHISWRDNSGAIWFGAWQPSSASPGSTSWQVDSDQVVVATGHLRWRNQPWLPPDQWAAQLASATRRARLPEVAERLRGVFAIAWLSVGGDVAVVTDPLGLRCIYYGENDEVVAVSSKAALVAQALVGEGQQPPRDAVNACWLAFSTYRIADATGFEGVRVVGPGAAIEIRRAPPGVVTDRGAPWTPDEKLQGLSNDEFIELAREDIAETLRATLDFPVDRHVIRLTGGKDSRLLLAVALWADLAQDFDYETIGPPTLADVRVASELAQRHGLRHDVKFLGLASSRPYADRVRDFVTATGGMLNLWDLSEPNTPPNELCVVGLCGEMLRTFRRVRVAVSSPDDLARLLGPQHLGRLRLLRPDVARQFHEMATGALLDDPSSRSEPLDLLDAFYIRNRLRFTRMGPQEELPGQRRIMPLYSIDALRAAFALGGAARQAEVLHFEIMRRCSDGLVRHPFAGPGWDPMLLENLPPEHARLREESESGRAELATAGKPESLMQSLQRTAFDERKGFFDAVLSDRGNPIWEFVQRGTADAALQRFESLSRTERRELYGALTAALWLGDELRS
jgi:hypothetical protein